MQFDAALAAQDTFRRAEAELGSDWDAAVELEDTFSSNAGATAREAYEGLTLPLYSLSEGSFLSSLLYLSSPGSR